MTDLFDLSGKVAMVTGGSRGLGYQMVKAFATHGADVFVTSRKIEACEKVAAEVRAMGRKAHTHACNVANWIELDGLVDAAYTAFGKVDILVNNAGSSPLAPSSLETPEQLFDRIVSLNFKAPFRLMSLVDTRTGHPDQAAEAPGRGRPARHYPESDFRAADYDRHIEDRYREYLRGSDADAIVATRPGLIAYLAKFGPRHALKIGQEHLVRGQHRAALRQAMPRHLRKLDAFVTVSQRDADDYRAHVRLPRTKLVFVPNGVPAPGVQVRLRGNGNLSTGGTAQDVTDHMHPEVARACVRAAMKVMGGIVSSASLASG